jgi:long-chain acyl-CoA synthetase
MNVLLKRREIAFYLEDSGAKLLLAWHGFAEEARAAPRRPGAELIEVEPRAFARLLGRTEPTRGWPNRERRHRGDPLHLGHDRQAEGRRADPRQPRRNAESPPRRPASRRGDVVLGALPLFHSFGQTVRMNASLASAPASRCCRASTRRGAGDDAARPRHPLLRACRRCTARCSTTRARELRHLALRICITGGAAMPVEVLRGFERRSAASSSRATASRRPRRSPAPTTRQERKPGSIGTPIEGVEMSVVDDDGNDVAQGEVGEIVIRGHNIMKGYWQRPTRPRRRCADGWFHTGDMAAVDEDGYFFIVDRKKDLIIRGGYNVYPREVEEVLYEHPTIREAAVVGVPTTSGRGGRRRGRPPGGRGADAEELSATSRSGSPPNKVIRRCRPGSSTTSQGPRPGKIPQARDLGSGRGLSRPAAAQRGPANGLDPSGSC